MKLAYIPTYMAEQGENSWDEDAYFIPTAVDDNVYHYLKKAGLTLSGERLEAYRKLRGLYIIRDNTGWYINYTGMKLHEILPKILIAPGKPFPEYLKR